MAHLPALPQLGAVDVHLAGAVPIWLYLHRQGAGWPRWRGAGNVPWPDWHHRLCWVYRGRQRDVDVAEHDALGCGHVFAQRADAWNARIELALPDLARF